MVIILLTIIIVTFLITFIFWWAIFKVSQKQSLEEERMMHSTVVGELGPGKGSYEELPNINTEGQITENK